MQFADSAGKFACGVQFCTCKEFKPFKLSYEKFLLVSTVVQNVLNLPENFLKVKKLVSLLF
jgi:hypothetical protein